MSVVRLLGFATLDCGCVVGRYQDVHANREVAYVEEKGPVCGTHLHRRNHTVPVSPSPRRFPAAEARASQRAPPTGRRLAVVAGGVVGLLPVIRSLAALPPPLAVVHRAATTRTFVHGNCLDVLARLEPGSVDVVVTSPPQNLGIRYRSYDDTLPRRAYLRWTRDWIGAVTRVLAPEGSFLLNVGAKPTDPWAGLDVARIARRLRTPQNTFHWIRSIAIDRDAAGGASLARDLAVGHHKPINSPRFVNDCHEYVFHFSHNGAPPLDRTAIGVPYQNKSNVPRWAGAAADRRCRGNTWFLPYETIKNRDSDRPHPATFPPRLPEQCIRLHGRDRVRLAVDPFTGLGSTAIACARMDVDFLGIDIDDVYRREAARRTAALDRPLID